MATENDTLRSALGRNCPGVVQVVQGWSRGGPTFEHPPWDRKTAFSAYKHRFFMVVQVVQGKTVIPRDTGGNGTRNRLLKGCVWCVIPPKGWDTWTTLPQIPFSGCKRRFTVPGSSLKGWTTPGPGVGHLGTLYPSKENARPERIGMGVCLVPFECAPVLVKDCPPHAQSSEERTQPKSRGERRAHRFQRRPQK